MMFDCSSSTNNPRRRSFWTTQPDACGTIDGLCGSECGSPGLSFTDLPDGRTIVTSDWMRSFILNILMTDARVVDSACGVSPAAVKGHWSDSYRTDGLRAGSRLRSISFKGLGINQIVAMINSIVSSDMNKIVRLGLAAEVNVDTIYLGNYTVRTEIEPVGVGGAPMDRVAITGTGNKSQNGWAWA